MCWWRRVYFNCRHEDTDVTPPQPILACEWAILIGSIEDPVYCGPRTREKTTPNVWKDAIIRDRPCSPCQQIQLRRRLDEEWHSFMRSYIGVFTLSEMEWYVKSRRDMFDCNHYGFWQELQATYINNCRGDIKAKCTYESGEDEAQGSA
ncbi:hypothetical protein F4781DRAFT_368616 [Annulohypoxylon bovei var. microspora]|nr:hypothetical protein F4781DRAFT_368616 [Annulohypoxylon bovei var. microspora]